MGGGKQCRSVQPVPRRGQTLGRADAPGLRGKGQDFGGAPDGGAFTSPQPNHPAFIGKHRAESSLPPSLKGLLWFPFPFQEEAEGEQLYSQRSFHP